LIWSG